MRHVVHLHVEGSSDLSCEDLWSLGRCFGCACCRYSLRPCSSSASSALGMCRAASVASFFFTSSSRPFRLAMLEPTTLTPYSYRENLEFPLTLHVFFLKSLEFPHNQLKRRSPVNPDGPVPSALNGTPSTQAVESSGTRRTQVQVRPLYPWSS